MAALSPQQQEEPLLFLGHPILINVVEMDKLPSKPATVVKKPATESASESGGLWRQFLSQAGENKDDACFGLYENPYEVPQQGLIPRVARQGEVRGGHVHLKPGA